MMKLDLNEINGFVADNKVKRERLQHDRQREIELTTKGSCPRCGNNCTFSSKRVVSCNYCCGDPGCEICS